MAAGDDAAFLEKDVDIVPVMEISLDFGYDLGVILAEAIHGLVREHNSPPEGTVGLIAFEYRDLAGRVGLLHQNCEIQPGRTTP